MRKFLVVILVAAHLWPITATASSCGWDQSPGWIARENQKAGDRKWSDGVPLRFSADFSRRKDIPRIEGFVSSSSATCGERLILTTSGSKRFVASVYRMGYYNNDGARLVMQLNSPKHIAINTQTPPGQYLIKLSSHMRAATFVPFVVYGNAASDLTFMSSVLTWQSYNQWGGYSLYKGPDGKRETHAQTVTFDRPYDGDGSGQFRYMEQPLITLMEKFGLDINYVTDLDVDKHPTIFNATKTIAVGGHSEYWTIKMRHSIEKAVASGVNLLAFGGNSAYAITEINNRKISGRTPYREVGQPESLLLGSQYFALGIKKDLISNNVWPFLSLGKDAVIKNLYGYEADTAMGSIGPAVQVLARAAISPTEKGFVAMSTYYNAPSGASVLNMGTNAWVCAMNNRCPWGHSFDSEAQKQITMVTTEVLKVVKSGKWPVAQIDIPSRP
ncbi:MAG: hypothetical protein FGM60_03545 [Candidatus Planktophila sp.]|nr:hypothetical protein [Candidatus Planktophila sp.]